MTRKAWSQLLSVAALGLLAVSPAAAQDSNKMPVVKLVPVNSNPPLPAGLTPICVINATSGAQSKTCPVVVYRGITTWAYSFRDNRTSLALVSYNVDNQVVRNVEKPGPRYIWNITVGEAAQSVTFMGQGQRFATVPWSELGPK